MPRGECLVSGQARFLEGVRERIVSDVVEQGGEVDVQLGSGTPGQMIRTQRVLEARVGSPRIDEKCVAELADVAEPLEGWRIDHRQSLGLEADVVPDRVADDLEHKKELSGSAAEQLSAWTGLPNRGGHVVGKL